jgi:hypothetical protein
MPLLLALMHIYCYCILCEIQQKQRKNWAFAMCLHTAKEPNVLCRMLAHGKGDTRRQTVLLGRVAGNLD